VRQGELDLSETEWHRFDAYGNTNEAIGLRPGQPIEMRSDVPSHVTSDTATATTAAIAIL
jgi:hypothetical protein